MRKIHPLRKYLDDHGLTQTEFAQRAGINATVLCRVLKGNRPRFSAEYALAIQGATDGAVRFADCWRPRSAAKQTKARKAVRR
jgi:transcriptional regulator with XRE-family HTH domain